MLAVGKCLHLTTGESNPLNAALERLHDAKMLANPGADWLRVRVHDLTLILDNYARLAKHVLNEAITKSTEE